MGIYNDEYMFHTGVKGMKWGKRTMSNIKTGISARNQATKDMIAHPIQSTKAQLHMIKKEPLKAIAGGTKAFQQLNTDVKNRVDNRQVEIKTNVKDYKQKFNDASKASDKADAHWQKTREVYKQTGKNAVSRIINNISGKSDTVKKYNKEFNKSEKLYNDADDKWAKSDAAYKKTGKNRVGQIINNMKY